MSPHIATQTIAGRFGTFHAGEAVDADLHPDVRDAWLAAGIIEEGVPTPRTSEPPEDATIEAPETATAPTRETATPPARENAAKPSGRKATTAHKRLQTDADQAPQARFEQAVSGPGAE